MRFWGGRDNSESPGFLGSGKSFEDGGKLWDESENWGGGRLACVKKLGGGVGGTSRVWGTARGLGAVCGWEFDAMEEG